MVFSDKAASVRDFRRRSLRQAENRQTGKENGVDQAGSQPEVGQGDPHIVRVQNNLQTNEILCFSRYSEDVSEEETLYITLWDRDSIDSDDYMCDCTVAIRVSVLPIEK